MRFERRFIVRLPRIAFLASFALLLTGQPARQQERPADPAQLVKAFSEKCAKARDYAIEGEMRLEAPGSSVGLRMRFSLAVSAAGKYALRLGQPSVGYRLPQGEPLLDGGPSPSRTETRREYWRISDGRRGWLYEPGVKRYVEGPADHSNEEFESEWVLQRQPDPAIRLGGYVPYTLSSRSLPGEGDPAEPLLRLLIPVLGGLADNAAQIQIAKGQKGAGPSIAVVSRDDAQGNYHRALLTFDPAGLALRGLNFDWFYVALRRLAEQLAINFTRFSVGEAQPEAAFSFVPPRGAQNVGALSVSGRAVPSPVGDAPPDFLANDIDGKELRFSTLRGRPVLLAFLGACQNCLTLAPLLEKIQQEYGPRGLVVLGIGHGSDALKRMVAGEGVTFRVFNDLPPYRNLPWKLIEPYLKDVPIETQRSPLCCSIYTLFHIHEGFPIVLVDRDWRVAGILREVDEASLRGMLKAAGI